MQFNFFRTFLHFENTVSKIIGDHNDETVSSITWKSIESVIEYISEIRKFSLIFEILKNKFDVEIFFKNLNGFKRISEFM